MRPLRLLLLLGLLAVAPLHAAAGTTTGARLVLSPTQGGLGSHFTATFTYSVPACNRYEVQLVWDPDNAPDVIGTAQPANSDSACQVTIAAAVPSNARADVTYTVLAAAHPATTSGNMVWTSNDPQGTAAYRVMPLSSQSASSSSSQGRTTPPSSTRSPAPLALGPAQGTGPQIATSSSSSNDAAAGGASGQSTSATAPAAGGTSGVTVVAPRPQGGGWGVALAIAVAALVLVGLALAVRSGRLRLPQRIR